MPLSVLPRSLIAPKQSLERYKKKKNLSLRCSPSTTVSRYPLLVEALTFKRSLLAGLTWLFSLCCSSGWFTLPRCLPLVGTGGQNLHLTVHHPVWTSSPAAAEPAQSCCCQAARPASVPVLSSPVSEPPSPVTRSPTQAHWLPQSVFHRQQVQTGVSSGLSCLTKGMGEKKKLEEVPRPSPEGRSPLHPGFQGRATRATGSVSAARFFVPPACRWTGAKNQGKPACPCRL